MKLNQATLTQVADVSGSYMIAPVTLFVGTNWTGKSSILRAIEYGLANEIHDPDKPTEPIKANSRIFKLAQGTALEMGVHLTFDDDGKSRSLTRRLNVKEVAGKATITAIPSFIGQSPDSIGKTAETEAEISLWLRPDPAGIRILEFPNLTESGRRELLINLVAGTVPILDMTDEQKAEQVMEKATGNGIEYDEFKAFIDLMKINPEDATTAELASIYDSMYVENRLRQIMNTNDGTLCRTHPDLLNSLLREYISKAVGPGDMFDWLHVIDNNAREEKRGADKELKNVEGSIKKLAEESETEIDPLEIEKLEEILKQLSQSIPTFTEKRGAAIANQKRRADIQIQIDRLPKEHVKCPGEWSYPEGFALCAGKGCKQCGGTQHADLKYCQGLKTKLHDAEDKAKEKATKDSKEFVEKRKAELTGLLKVLKKKADEIDISVAAENVGKVFDEKLATLQGEIKKLAESRSMLVNSLNDEDSARNYHDAEAATLKVFKSSIHDENPRCPLCDNEIDTGDVRAFLDKKIKEREAERDKRAKKVEALATERAAVITAFEKADSERTALKQERFEKVAEAKVKFENEAKALVNEHNELVRQLDELDGKAKAELSIKWEDIMKLGRERFKAIDHLCLDIENADSVTDTRVALEQEMEGIDIPDVEELNTFIRQAETEQQNVTDRLSKARHAEKVTEQHTRYNEQAEILRVRTDLLKLLIKSVGTKGLQGELLKQQTEPFVNIVNEVLVEAIPNREFAISFYDVRGNEACEFVFINKNTGVVWTWETASRAERTIASIAMAIARMQINTRYTMRVLMVDNLDMMDVTQVNNLDAVLHMCLKAHEEGWIDNALLAGVINPEDIPLDTVKAKGLLIQEL